MQRVRLRWGTRKPGCCDVNHAGSNPEMGGSHVCAEDVPGGSRGLSGSGGAGRECGPVAESGGVSVALVLGFLDRNESCAWKRYPNWQWRCRRWVWLRVRVQRVWRSRRWSKQGPDQLFEQINDDGPQLTGDGSSLPEMIRVVLERGLQAELSEDLDYDKGPHRSGSPNFRNGSMAHSPCW